MRLPYACVAALFGASVVSTASATVTFSFASDTNSDGPTFYGNQVLAGPLNLLSDGAAHDNSGAVLVGLMVDPNGDSPGGGTTFMSVFDFTGVTTGYEVNAVANGYLHSWTMAGSFTFTDSGTGLEVLQIDFSNAVFSSFSADEFELGTSASVQANAMTDMGLTFIPGAPLLGLGITPADLAAEESFAFSLNSLVSAEDSSLPLHLSAGGGWFHDWIAEGSFSGGANLIPGPGALALLGLGALVGRRRRR